ncbi:gamma-glutamylcyclotransferase [Phyllobacterium sp. 21LDTY02-6]|uniref:gamma-glutamylcyclotransferase n=1 Tax=unclassified Phyllobacterium TaxID=2638441 RepID=UPI002022969F|nr:MULTISPECIES: gamma-glutamylcyclotransferase [unclassified Phyllobacterium]MCO4317758.1 gamma-glutamylcyclotransferase [Phyllobacterium sp. 21LDTY02-6]MCX8281549.1 gamma-glutamylcyclotransferase [Phyllobacterium sp. 0TCS1.6C]MCX8292855.1 gamma-glutamylcyclotransferase [Phyllobacterium sp. 0TCS1.6A]
MGDFWVFGYGSLMWKPGFAHVETHHARLHGYRRSLCVRSHVHRGTPQRPGLVLGLDRGGSCLGMAFRVPGELEDEVVAYLRERELVTHVYLERKLGIRLADGRKVEALTYIVDRQHVQYAGSLTVEEAAAAVRGSVGQSGRNEDYVRNTLEHMHKMNISDHWMEAVAAAMDSPGN